jgi:TonB family protein
VSLRRAAAGLAVLAVAAGIGRETLHTQEVKSEAKNEAKSEAKTEALIENTRHTKSRIQPAYPELARKMNLTGIVKVQVVVSPNGSVKDVRALGGHPVLVNAALDAVRKWRFEPAPVESSGLVDIKFEGHQ